MQLAKRIRQIPPSATLALNAKANQLKSQGVEHSQFWGGGAGLRHPGKHPGSGHSGH